ncbi:MAG TPA: hypothetical protein VGO00_19915 [Kofleriaceae bacterium]|nr:hypothetical protein [Kofleriaceae bacterium]
MSRTWLLALVGVWLAACACPPDKRELKAFAPAKIYQDDIKQCEAYGNCDSLCIRLFSLDPSNDIVDHCTITHVDDTGVAVTGLIEVDNVCAADGDLVIGDDGDYVDDGGDSGDDGTVDDGGGDDGSTGDDGGGDDGGGDDGSFAPKHHQVAKHPLTGSRA